MSKRKPAQGAVRKKSQAVAVKPSRKIGRYIALAILLVPLGLQLKNIPWAEIVPSVDVSVNEDAHVSNVLIEGHFQYSDKMQLQLNIQKMLATDFVRLDIRALQAKLEAEPWYKTVSVERVWPSSLKVIIEEQQPIALWGHEAFINRYGEVIKVENIENLLHLPVLVGNDENAYKIAKDYLTMSQLMNRSELYISGLTVSSSGDWKMEVDRSFTIELGDKNISQRLERFVYLYGEQLGELKSEMALVDMRYKNGIAVRWKNTSINQVAGLVGTNDMVNR